MAQQGVGPWTTSLLKRWLLGTHAGAVRDKHLQAYLDEFAFRHNRRKTNGVGRIAPRLIESLVAKPPMTMRKIIDATQRCRDGAGQISRRWPELKGQACLLVLRDEVALYGATRLAAPGTTL